MHPTLRRLIQRLGVDGFLHSLVDDAEMSCSLPFFHQDHAPSNAILERFPKEQRLLAARYMHTLHLCLQEMQPKTVSVTIGKKVMLLLLSDWHIGKKVELHHHVYNLSRAKSYLEVLVNQVVELQKIHQADALLCLCLGDMVDGACIYDHQAYHLELDPHQQVGETVRLLWQALRQWCSCFETVYLYGVRGNHGRTNKYSPTEANWDLMVYMHLKLLSQFAAELVSNLVVDYTTHEYYHLFHGPLRLQLRHHGPAQTETASASSRYSGFWDLAPYDAICIGHFHHLGVEWHQGRPVMMNGCFPGVDDLAAKLGKVGRPAQLAAVYTLEQTPYPYGIYPIYLDILNTDQKGDENHVTGPDQ